MKINPELLIVGHTAYAFQEDIEMMKQAGLKNWLIKPVNKDDLFRISTAFY